MTLENIADELYSIKQALAEMKAPKIVGSLYTLSKLTKQAANESTDIESVGQLLQLAELLEDLSIQVTQASKF